MTGYTYIMTNQTNTVLYTGATADLVQRTYLHRNLLDSKSFTCRYRINKLVYYEIFEDLETAFTREKQIKWMKRKKKKKMISKFNPEWKDLYNEILELNLCKNTNPSVTI